jgi:hypothetical protein
MNGQPPEGGFWGISSLAICANSPTVTGSSAKRVRRSSVRMEPSGLKLAMFIS